MKSTLRPALRSEAGFSLPELLVATGILLVISSAVTSGMLRITNAQKTIANRVDMHAGIRSATELLQQEVGQAGRLAIPGGMATLVAAIGGGGPATVNVQQTISGVTANNVSGFFVGAQIDVDAGSPNQETVTITAVDTAAKTITATYAHPHNALAPVNVFGGFAAGIVPPGGAGSSATVLKMFGDINGDGNMVYVEYTCDTAGGNFYRNVMPYDAVAKPPLTPAQVLLNNIQQNPIDPNTGVPVPCFTYLPNPLWSVNGQQYVLDVAITLTVRTQTVDPVTRQLQTETKALLNVSPRNVFDVWQLASAGVTTRVQPMPASVTTLVNLP